MEFAKLVAKKLHDAGGEVLAVGGFVRDSLLGLEPKDVDLLVRFLSEDEVVAALSEFGVSGSVGKSFGVFVASQDGEDVEVALPRLEAPVDGGRQSDFVVSSDPFLPLVEDAKRRDLTVNALFVRFDGEDFDFDSGLVDFFGGVGDLENGVLRHCSGKFAEDPLRVFRVGQFAGRFGFSVAPETRALCASLADRLHLEARERVFQEFVKLLRKSKSPSLGLRFLRDVGALAEALPRCAGADDSLAAVDLVSLVDSQVLSVQFAALLSRCPDADSALRELRAPNKLRRDVVRLLGLVQDAPNVPQFVQRLLKADRLRPLVDGGDLLQLGLQPGPQFGHLLRQVALKQVNNGLDSRAEALALVRSLL